MVGKRGQKAVRQDRVAELEEALERQMAINAALREVGAAIGKTLDIDELLSLILSRTTDVLGADRGTLFLLEGDRLVSRILKGGETAVIEVALGQGIAGHVALTGRPLRVKDAYRDARFDPEWDKLTGYRTRSILAAPLKNHDGKIVGVVQMLNKGGGEGEPEAFTKHDADLLVALAAQAAVALDKARLFCSVLQNNERLSETSERLERSLRDIELLYQLERAMGRAESLDDLARSVVTWLAGSCSAAAGALLVRGAEEELSLYVVQLASPEEVRKVIVQPGEGVAARALRKRRLLTISSERAIADPTRVKELIGIPVRRAMAAPLMGEGRRPIGALALYNHAAKPARFTGSYGSLLELVSGSVYTHLRLFRAREERERHERLTSLGRLISGLMHDLRTPLTVISGYAQLMEVSDDPSLRAEYASTINEQFEFIASMQRDLLSYARGETSVLIRKVYLSQFFERLTKQLERHLADTEVELVVDLGDSGTAFFDESKIARALQNLARNAIEAMAEGGGTLTLGCHSDDEFLNLTVADTGSGVPKAIRHKLFEPFVTSGKKLGTGLGLSIVKSIVTDHGGDVDVQTSGRGTVFTISLPQGGAPRSRRPRSMSR
ncbi:MAG: GAF domain-containing protein [Deltaproteobacteria bacterium]|nr:GAF domain-containing protein [Deltaproteobacteria bacterium]MBW2529945.1 GAF domain-containing protein [Deltaproteobacteria bacterium]